MGEALIEGELRDEGMELLTREEPALRRVILRYVHDHSCADDLFQDISLKVLRRFNNIRDRRTMRGWIFQVARNACLDYLRAQKSRPNKSDIAYHDDGASGDLGRNPAERFGSERVEGSTRPWPSYPRANAKSCNYVFEDGPDHVAISERLGISRQAVEVRLYKSPTIKSQLSAIYGGSLMSESRQMSCEECEDLSVLRSICPRRQPSRPSSTWPAATAAKPA